MWITSPSGKIQNAPLNFLKMLYAAPMCSLLFAHLFALICRR